MTQVTIPTPFGASVGVTPMKLLSVNSARKFLQLQNQGAGGVTVRVKFDSTFTPARSGQQTVSFSPTPDAGGFTLTYGADTTPEQAFNVDAATLQAALEGLTSIGAGNVVVTGTMVAGFTITFQGSLANVPTTALSVSSSTLTSSTGQQSAIQLLHFSAVPTGGTFQLVDSAGNHTADLAFDITAYDLGVALNALPAIDGGISNITQDPTSLDFVVTFAAAGLVNTEVPLLGVSNVSLTSTVAEASCVQKLYATPAPLQGQFQLMVNNDTSPALDFDASAAEIQAALEYMPSIGAGNVAVAGSNLVSGFTITFQGDLANTVVPLLHVVNSTMHPDILEEPQKRVPDDIQVLTVITVAGHGTDDVVLAPSFIQEGVAPAPSVSTVTVVVEGNVQPTEGMLLTVGGPPMFYDAAVPIGEVWAVASGANTPVQVWEG